ncbi:MAG: hypothetical protein WBQ18_01545 [Solirubrobacteraceae bacterium]
MQISSVSHAATSQAAVAARQLTASNVTATALKTANNDGDGRTGTAALNDGDSASQSARRGAVNITA